MASTIVKDYKEIVAEAFVALTEMEAAQNSTQEYYNIYMKPFAVKLKTNANEMARQKGATLSLMDRAISKFNVANAALKAAKDKNEDITALETLFKDKKESLKVGRDDILEQQKTWAAVLNCANSLPRPFKSTGPADGASKRPKLED